MKILIHHFDQNAHGIVRFSDHEIIGVYDERPELNGKSVKELLNVDKNIVLTNDFDKALDNAVQKNADLMITTGEGLYFTKPNNVADWKKNITKAIENNLNIYNLSKILYGDKTKDLKELAKKHKVKFDEASDTHGYEQFFDYALKGVDEPVKTPIINFTGTSMNSGKITAMFIIKQKLEKKGKKISVIGTEPSSIFMGADEQVIPEVYPTLKATSAIFGAIKKVELEKKPDLILVGNQTGLKASVHDFKEARAGAIVAWQIMLASKPDKIILCSKWNNTKEIKPHLELIKHSIDKQVIALIINGHGGKKDQVMDIINETEKKYNIPTMDVFLTPEKVDELVSTLL